MKLGKARIRRKPERAARESLIELHDGGRSTPDLDHGEMAPFHHSPDGAMMEGLVAEGFVQLLLQFLVAGAGAQERLQVGQLFGEEAGLQLAVGREAEAIAGPAKMVAHRADKPDLPGGPGEFEETGRPAVAVSAFLEGNERGNLFDPRPSSRSTRCSAPVFQSLELPMGMYSMNRTWKGSRRVRRAKSSISRSLNPAMATTLILMGEIPSRAGRLDPLPDPLQIPPAGDLPVFLGVEGVHADVHPFEPGPGQLGGEVAEKEGVGGHGEVPNPVEPGDLPIR